jgi:alkanesulfonate monooxygenase SsuD/methylene tetrahydromethanopterin reductase-like flavin-dependent oxidoreductase (luciferase family)
MVSRGSALARELAQRYGRPLLLADLQAPDAAARAASWLRTQREAFGADLARAIGGPRESEAPGIYARATIFLGAVLNEAGV